MSEFNGITATYVSDCTDQNARVRQEVRAGRFFPGAHVAFCDVGREPHHSDSYDPTIAAAGMVVDALDAADGYQAIVMVNVAPRHGEAKREHWPNGSPFGYARVGKGLAIVVGTIQGYTFSLLKKLAGVEQVEVLDLQGSLAHLRVPEWHAGTRIADSQFRSYDYLPRATQALVHGRSLPSKPWSGIPDMPGRTVWWTDNFGNCKTNLLPTDVGFWEGQYITVGNISAVCHRRLADVEDGQTAFTVGSSGFKDKRFVELVVCGGSAAKRFGLGVGSRL